MSRIISGIAGGQKLKTLAGNNTRPTTDRVRESFFATLASWLGETGSQPLSDISFLDLYGGSGAVGLEAASRGAKPVVLVEFHPPAIAVIRENIAALASVLPAMPQLVGKNVAQYLSLPANQAFDVVWLDPPYMEANENIESCLMSLVENDYLLPDALVCVERSTRSRPFNWPAALENSWIRKYGETSLYFAQYDNSVN